MSVAAGMAGAARLEDVLPSPASAIVREKEGVLQ